MKREQLLILLFAIFLSSAISVGILSSILLKKDTEQVKSSAFIYCEEQEGIIEVRTNTDGSQYHTCLISHHIITEHAVALDNSFECEIEAFYRGECPEEEHSPDYSTPILGTDSQVLGADSKDLNKQLKAKVDDILSKLKHTGYTHHNYVRDDAKGLSFTDCSGFVDHLLKEELPDHYKVLSQNYSCTHSLAADYYDYFNNSSSDPETKKCWQKIEKVSDALPGDILVYKSTDNISTDKQKCTNGEDVFKLTGDSGHVMVIHSHPKSSSCNDSDQYYVRVADSTASPHYHDTRKGDAPDNNFGLDYNSWYYEHTQKNGQKYYTHSGLGTGTLWLDDDMNFFRWKSCSGEKHLKDITIGRPVECME